MRYFEEAGKAAGSQAMQDAIQTICGQARHRGPSCDVYVRLAWHAGKCYLDLGDEEWRAIEIDTEGWRVNPSAARKISATSRNEAAPHASKEW